MSGPVAELSEIACGSYDAFTEMVFPDSIDHHAGYQGIFGGGDGIGQFQSAATLAKWLGLLLAKDRQKSSWHLLAEVRCIATNSKLCIRRPVRILEDMPERIGLRDRFFENRRLGAKCFQILFRGRPEESLHFFRTVVIDAAVELQILYFIRVRCQIAPKVKLLDGQSLHKRCDDLFRVFHAFDAAELDVIAVIDGFLLRQHLL